MDSIPIGIRGRISWTVVPDSAHDGGDGGDGGVEVVESQLKILGTVWQRGVAFGDIEDESG